MFLKRDGVVVTEPQAQKEETAEAGAEAREAGVTGEAAAAGETAKSGEDGAGDSSEAKAGNCAEGNAPESSETDASVSGESPAAGDSAASMKAAEAPAPSILGCIRRIPSVIEQILAQQYESFAPLFTYLDDSLERIDEIVFIGSGTSATAAATSRQYVEKVSGLRTKLVAPEEYADPDSVLNPNALHVFTSQTGTSKQVLEVMRRLSAEKLLCVSLTESEETPLAQESPCHVTLNCGREEFLMRTIGYAASVLNHMLLGLMLGLRRGTLGEDEYQKQLGDAALLSEDHREVTKNCLDWFKHSAERKLMRAQCVVFTGAGALNGVAQEAAIKFWEMPQIASMGLELEEGLHGPTYGYSYPHCVVVLSDGGRQAIKALALARYLKNTFGSGIVIGPKTIDGADLKVDLRSGAFGCIAVSAVPQIMAYFLAEDSGRDLSQLIDHSAMNSYFTTHQ